MIDAVLRDPSIVPRPTALIIKRESLAANLELLRNCTARRVPLMAVVKGDAYGHGLTDTARLLVEAGADSLAVAVLEEGVALRRAGIEKDILVLGGLSSSQIPHYLDHRLEFAVASTEKLEHVASHATPRNPARVHLKVDTGMGRYGVQWDRAEPFLRAAASAPNIDVAGIFSHLACSDDTESSFTAIQVARFSKVLKGARELGLVRARAHLANSAGVLHHPETHFDLIRPGIALYGVMPCPVATPALRPALSWFTQVSYFKVLQRGDPVGYGGTWTAPQRTRIATLPVGYADGYPQSAGGKASVIIRGVRYPVVGRICMDAVMVDLGPEGTAFNGDRAILVGATASDEIRIEDIARWADRSPYEVLTALGRRVPRFYMK